MNNELDYLPTMPKQLDHGIGCIGAGFIMADCHLVAYRNAGIRPIGIASKRFAQAKTVAQRHDIPHAYESYQDMLRNPRIEVVDVAVPPDCLLNVIRDVTRHPNVRGVLVQKPMGVNSNEAKQIVDLCHQAGITLCVNQNMRYDQSVGASKCLLDRGEMGDPVLATIDMRAIPHWMPWQQRMGWLTCRIMSIHHLDTMRYWFGEPQRVFASFSPDPRTAFPHRDGICLYILEYESGLRCSICDDVWAGPAREGAASDLGIAYRIEGTQGMIRGTIGWPDYPKRTPSTLDYTTTQSEQWKSPRWDEVWFPDAFLGPMVELLVALESDSKPTMNGEDNLKTMALVDACYRSAETHQAIPLKQS